jgi:hypothetical protein
MTDEFRVDITDADVRTAKRAWLAARDGDASSDRVQRLLDEYEQLVKAQAQQIADDFRRGRDPGS